MFYPNEFSNTMKKYLFLLFCITWLAACQESAPENAGQDAGGETPGAAQETPESKDLGIQGGDASQVQEPSEGVLDQIPAKEVRALRVIRFYNYQQTSELAENLVDPADYEQWKSVLMTAIRRRIAGLPEGEGFTGRMVVAANASRELRSWFLFPNGQPKGDLREAIVKAIRDVPTPDMKQGYVVFGVQVDLWDADSRELPDPGVPMPKTWTEAGKQFDGPQPVAKLLEAAWNVQ